MCNGKLINELPKKKVYILNKLKGYISTSNDPQGRKCVIDLINSSDRLFTIGRLDRDTTGIILITNDGELANILMHPRNKIERVYIVSTKVDILNDKRKKLENGLKLPDGYIVYGKLYRLNKKGGLIYWKVVLKEGRNHEVKNIFKILGSRVEHLHRESFAGLKVDNINPGKYKMLSKIEIQNLYKKSFSIKK